MPIPDPRLRTAPDARPSLAADERGAILVLGIFMCSCMVGALWYLAGIGDAIIYRERMQEASDAVAFSGAVLHARGMNLLVLLNLIMAVILAIRVAMKAAQAALFIVGAILAVIPGLQALSTAAFTAGRALQVPINATRSPINQTIKALSKTQAALARIVPPAALVGSYQIGTRYKPIVQNSAAGSPFTVRDGLPVEEDKEDKLCQKAGEAVGSVLSWAAPIPRGVANRVKGMIGRLVRAGGAYFCEVGSGGGAPDLARELGNQASEACDEEERQLQERAAQAARSYEDACTRYSCNTSGTLTPAQQAELANLAAERDRAQQQANGFNHDRCVDDKQRRAKDAYNREVGTANNPPSANGQGMTPKKVRANWKNGVNHAQVVAIATGNQASLAPAPALVKVGSWRTPIDIKVPTSARFALAQAEFFYDCGGAWTSNDCNGTGSNAGNAMWHFKWRARLRRYNAPFGTNAKGLEDLTEALAGADAFRAVLGVDLMNSSTWQNARLISEVGRAVGDREIIIH